MVTCSPYQSQLIIEKIYNGTLLLALGLDLDPHFFIRTRYPSFDLEPHKGPRPPFRFTPGTGSSDLNLHL